MDKIVNAKNISITYDLDENNYETKWTIESNRSNEVLYNLALLFEKHRIDSWGFRTSEVYKELKSNCSTPVIIVSYMEEEIDNNRSRTL